MLQEYDQLTNKIHDLQLREQELQEQVLEQEKEVATPPSAPLHHPLPPPRSPSPHGGVFSMDDTDMQPSWLPQSSIPHHPLHHRHHPHQSSSQPLTPSLTPNNSSGNLLGQATAGVGAGTVAPGSGGPGGGGSGGTGVLPGQGSPQVAPRSPMKNTVKAYLPNNQKTAVSTN